VALDFTQVRIPDIEDQNYARQGTPIPGLMLKGIIEGKTFAESPFDGFSADL